jgi:hypothetical protein
MNENEERCKKKSGELPSTPSVSSVAMPKAASDSDRPKAASMLASAGCRSRELAGFVVGHVSPRRDWRASSEESSQDHPEGADS